MFKKRNSKLQRQNKVLKEALSEMTTFFHKAVTDADSVTREMPSEELSEKVVSIAAPGLLDSAAV